MKERYRVWIHYAKGGDDRYIEFNTLPEAMAFSNKKISGEYHEKPLLAKGSILKGTEQSIPRSQLKKAIKNNFGGFDVSKETRGWS